jgi:hypothetical protein
MRARPGLNSGEFSYEIQPGALAGLTHFLKLTHFLNPPECRVALNSLDTGNVFPPRFVTPVGRFHALSVTAATVAES